MVKSAPWLLSNRAQYCINEEASLKKHLSILLLALFLGAGGAARAADSGLLPPVFNGWKLSQSSVKAGFNPAAADPADFDVLKEYGFTDFESATYTRSGRSMEVKAARFKDASGAFGAFTYYVHPQMQTEQIGDRAASNNSRVLFYRGNILVDANLAQVTAMSAADLRALAEALPRPRGNLSALPTLPGNLPKEGLRANTERYIMGPVALERAGVPLPASLVDFNKGAEIEFARYRSSQGEAGLTLIEYPTPQIAVERMRALQAASLPGGPFTYKRTGPIVAVVSGIPDGEAQELLARVNYDADVTWNQPTKLNPTEDRASFIIAEVLLVLIVLAIAMVIGLIFGGSRMIARRLFPNRDIHRPDEVEIIRLNLK
jgi:hypothetical protein